MSILKVDTLQPAAASTVHIAGHVIGFGYVEHSTQLNVTSSSFVDSGISISYTAKSANSKLLIHWSIPVEIYDGGSNSEVIGQMQLFKDGTTVGSGTESLNTSENVKRSGSSATAEFSIDAGDTSAHTYSLKTKTSSDTLTVFRYGDTGSLRILEIAQ